MTAAHGVWIQVAEGIKQYCTIGHHFTDGPGFAYVEERTPLIRRHYTCAECAKEATS